MNKFNNFIHIVDGIINLQMKHFQNGCVVSPELNESIKCQKWHNLYQELSTFDNFLLNDKKNHIRSQIPYPING